MWKAAKLFPFCCRLIGGSGPDSVNRNSFIIHDKGNRQLLEPERFLTRRKAAVPVLAGEASKIKCNKSMSGLELVRREEPLIALALYSSTKRQWR